jgi:hypothetical protein
VPNRPLGIISPMPGAPGLLRACRECQSRGKQSGNQESFHGDLSP